MSLLEIIKVIKATDMDELNCMMNDDMAVAFWESAGVMSVRPIVRAGIMDNPRPMFLMDETIISAVMEALIFISVAM